MTGADDFIGKFYQEKDKAILYKLFKQTQKRNTLYSLYEASITLIPKPN